MKYSETRSGMEFLILDGKLTITPQRRQAGQLQLDRGDIEWLMGFLSSTGAISGMVKLVRKYPDDGLIYHVRLEHPDDPERSLIRELTVFEGSVEYEGPAEKWGQPGISDEDAAEDRKEGD